MLSGWKFYLVELCFCGESEVVGVFGSRAYAQFVIDANTCGPSTTPHTYFFITELELDVPRPF